MKSMFKQNKTEKIFLFVFLFLISGCTPGIMKCFLRFDKYQNSYTFNFSKDALKTKIVEAYSYNENLLLKNLGKTLIENEQVNTKYRTSTENWLDRKSWDKFKEQIRKETSDTLNLVIGKHHRRKTITFKVIINGNDKNSELTISDVEYQRKKACEKDISFYQDVIQRKIEQKFINRIR